MSFLLQPPLPWGHGAEALLHGSLPSHSCGEGVSTHPALLQGGWVGACRQKDKDTRRVKDAFTSQKGPKARQTWGERKEERERERESQNDGGRGESREEVKPNGHKHGRAGTTIRDSGEEEKLLGCSCWEQGKGTEALQQQIQAQQYHAGFVLKAQQHGNMSPASICCFCVRAEQTCVNTAGVLDEDEREQVSRMSPTVGPQSSRDKASCPHLRGKRARTSSSIAAGPHSPTSRDRWQKEHRDTHRTLLCDPNAPRCSIIFSSLSSEGTPAPAKGVGCNPAQETATGTHSSVALGLCHHSASPMHPASGSTAS